MSSPRPNTLFRSIALLLIGAVLGWQLNLAYSPASAGNSSNNGGSRDLDLSLLWNVWDLIQEDYVNLDSVATQDQSFGVVKGLVESLGDPYSVFMDPEETKSFNDSLSGSLEGIGAELTVKDEKLIILSPLKESPAEKAGILPGDYIYLVDGEPTSEMTLWEAIQNIRGTPGTTVTLTLIREGVEEPFELTITRQAITVPSVELTYETVRGQDIAHLSIYQFGDETTREFEKAVQALVLRDPDGLIIDLRMNGGGYLDASIEILSEFFSDERTGVIVKYRNRDDEVIKTKGQGRLADIPMVVLIDEGSASASEILAGALQDYDRATLIGVQSFGKGSVQELDDLNDGSTLRLTVAKWYTPLDRSISEVGITPDIEVTRDANANDATEDVQLEAAFDYLSK